MAAESEARDLWGCKSISDPILQGSNCLCGCIYGIVPAIGEMLELLTNFLSTIKSLGFREGNKERVEWDDKGGPSMCF